MLHQLRIALCAVLCTAVAFGLQLGCGAGIDSDQAMSLQDAGLQAAVLASLGKPGGQLYDTDMASLTRLEGEGYGIVSIAELSQCTSLVYADLANNSITDFSPLAEVTTLTTLLLDHANVSNLSFLTTMTNLHDLRLSHNSIVDLAPLAGLVHLTYLDLDNNQIVEVTALRNNTDAGGIATGDSVRLVGNSLSGTARFDDIPYMLTQGANVVYIDGGTNDPPAVMNVTAGGSSGNITITYDLIDTDGDPSTLTVQFMGGPITTWTNATISESLTNVSTGTGKTLTWQSNSDVHIDSLSGVAGNDFVVRITPNDGAAGSYGQTAPFTVTNPAVRRLLAVGLDNDSGGTFGANIKGASEAAAIHECLLLDTTNWSSGNMSTLADSSATTSTVSAALSSLASIAVPGDLTVLYISTELDITGAPTTYGFKLYNNVLADTALAATLATFDTGTNVVVFVQAPYAAGVIKGSPIDLGQHIMDLMWADVPYVPLLKGLTPKAATVGWVTSNPSSDTFQVAKPVNAFTGFLLQGLFEGDGNSDGSLTPMELFQHIQPLAAPDPVTSGDTLLAAVHVCAKVAITADLLDPGDDVRDLGNPSFTAGSTLHRTLYTKDDVDYLKITKSTVTSSVTINANVTGGQSFGDPILYLENSVGGVITSNDDGIAPYSATITTNLDAGTYYIRIQANAHSGSGLKLPVREITLTGNGW